MVYETKEALLKLGQIDPELEEILKTHPLPEIDYSDLVAFKKVAEERQKFIPELLGPPPAGVRETETHYTTRDGVQMRSKLYQPSTPPSQPSPLIVMFHAGGWCMGVLEMEETVCRNLVLAFDATCVACSYRLAPEYKFPTGVLDAWDALKWAAQNARSLGADPAAGFVLGGTSAGANFTAVLSHKARDEGLRPRLTGLYLAAPALGGENLSIYPERYRERIVSHEQNEFAPIMPKAGFDMILGGYAPEWNDHELFSIVAHARGHQSLPPTFAHICGMDPVRDEGLVYVEMLKDAGVTTRVKVMSGLPHDFWTLMPQLKSSHLFRKEQVEGFGWLLGRDQKEVELQSRA